MQCDAFVKRGSDQRKLQAFVALPPDAHWCAAPPALVLWSASWSVGGRKAALQWHSGGTALQLQVGVALGASGRCNEVDGCCSVIVHAWLHVFVVGTSASKQARMRPRMCDEHAETYHAFNQASYRRRVSITGVDECPRTGACVCPCPLQLHQQWCQAPSRSMRHAAMHDRPISTMNVISV
jgi:hypothetical protein